MQKSFLEKNPFYILEVMPGEKRASIISKAEEKAFFSDGNECEEAQAKLLNPEKRLAAELDWFFGISIESLADINNCICGSKEIITDDLNGVSHLNATLYNFSISSYDDYFELGYAILELDELYSGIDIEALLCTINSCRQQAGIRKALMDELEREFNKKRQHIRHLISEKIAGLSDEDYIDFITMVAEKFIADEDYNEGVIISDVVDQYEINMQSLIEKSVDEIYIHIERTRELSNDEAIENSITALIQQVEKWDRLVQPLQLKSMASGVSHKDSEKIGHELHQFAVWLQNEKELSSQSLRLIKAMKPIFAEIGDLLYVFETDEDTLTNIIKNNEEAEQAVAQIKALKTSADSLKNCSTSSRVDEFISKVREVNRTVQQISLDDELVQQARENICNLARDVAITLHNKKHQTANALKIVRALLEEFGDLSAIKMKLIKDVVILEQEAQREERTRQQLLAQERASKAKNIGCFIGVAVFILILSITCLSKCISSVNSKTSSVSSDADGYSNNVATYTVFLDKQNGTGGTTSVRVSYGQKLPDATAPTRTGYVFKGYFSESNGCGTRYYDSRMVAVTNWYGSRDITLYAYWVREDASSIPVGINITKYNFDNYFTLTTDAECIADIIKITYTIRPKSSTYADNINSSDTISVQLGGVVSSLDYYYGEPSWDKKYTVTLNKNQNYTASGSFAFTYYAITDTVYWLADVVYCSGRIGQ